MKRKDDFLLENVGGVHLLVPLGAQVANLNGMITLSETGAFLWELLQEECTEDELAQAVVEAYAVPFSQALADVEIFIHDVAALGMIDT